MDLYAANLDEKALVSHFSKMIPVLEKHAAETQVFAPLFRHLALLAGLLSEKCGVLCRIRSSYQAGDKEALRQLAEKEIPALAVKAEAVRNSWRALWMAWDKPFGFEVVDIRMGGAVARLNSAAARILEYVDGDFEKLDELEVPVLPMDSFTPGAG